MPRETRPLYDENAAEALRERERARKRQDREKFELLDANIPPCRRLVDIGCGWGQLLARVRGRVREPWGVDESPDRVRDVRQVCPEAKVVVCRAERLELPDGYFDVAVMSQMLHEVALFGEPGALETVLGEVCRVLAPGGRCLLLDHAHAGEGDVAVRLPERTLGRLAVFEEKYRYYDASHDDLGGGEVRIARRTLQDFLTKDWSLGTPMQSVEMNETHNVFRRAETLAALGAAGLSEAAWTPFQDIGGDLDRAGGEWLEGERWCRKFLCVATKR